MRIKIEEGENIVGRKWKKRCLALMTALTMMAGLFMGNVSELQVKADSTAASVTIGNISLETGWYVEASDATGSGAPISMRGVDKVSEQPQSGGYFYFDKDTATMTVYNDMEINVSGPIPVTVADGTLTISGSGNLKIIGTAPVFQFTGTAPSVVTKDYTGNFYAESISLVVTGSGTGVFDIQTTGNITLIAHATSSPAFSAITTVTLNGKNVTVTAATGQIDNGLTNLNWIQSEGDITLTTSSYSNPIFTAANLKLKTEDGNVDLQSTAGAALTASNNIEIEASGDIDLKTSNGLLALSTVLNPTVSKEMKLVSQNGNVKIDGNNNSVIAEGKLNIQAPNGKVDIAAASDTPMIQAELDIKAKNDITLNQTGTNNASLAWGGAGGNIESTDGNIMIRQSGSAPVVSTQTAVGLQSEGTITIQRAIQGSYDMISAIPATGVIQLIDGSNKSTIIDGTVYSAAGCTHPRRVNGKCVVCDDQETVAVVTEGGNTTAYGSLADAFQAANKNNTVKLMLDYKDKSEVIGLSSSYNQVNLDLNNHRLEVGSFNVSNKLSVSNGKMKLDSLSNSNTGHSDKLLLDGVEAEIHDISWTANGGLELKASKLNVGSQTTRCSFFVEMITIAEDDDSVITVQNMSSGLANYGNVPEFKDVLEKLVPMGYSVYVNTSSATGREVTVADASGIQARNLVLRNKRLAEADITLNPGTFVYDGTAKEPAVTVMYDGATLTEGTDYTVTYSDNINVSDHAAATISGPAFRDSVTKYFSITKANRNAPAGLVAVAETIDGKNDGKIRNVDSEMEYSMDGTTYTAISGNELTGLSDGTYLVRYKETQNYYVSPATQVIVEKGMASSENINPPGQTGGTTPGGDTDPSGNKTGDGTADTSVPAASSVPTASSVQNAAGTATASGNATIKTGDENQVMLYLIMLICAAGVVTVTYSIAKSKKFVKR